MTVETATGAILLKTLQRGESLEVYTQATASVATMRVGGAGAGARLADGMVATMAALLHRAEARPSADPRLLSPTTLRGVPVDVVRARVGEAAGPGHAQLVATFDIDPRTYALWGVTAERVPVRGAASLVESMRVLSRQVVALSAVPAGTFSARPTAAAAPTPGTRTTLPGLESLTVAQAVAQPGMPALLLANGADGLRLVHVVAVRANGQRSVSWAYHVPATVEAFSVEVTVSGAGAPAGPLAPAGAAAKPMSVSVAGTRVRAVYATPSAAAMSVQLLAYRQGTATVTLIGSGLTRTQFLAAVHGLVNGRRDAALVARLEAQTNG